MTWPQYVILAFMLFGLTSGVTKAARDRTISTTEATLHVLIVLAIHAFYAYVLHAGGFW